MKRTSPKPSTRPSANALVALCLCLLAPATVFSSGGHGGLPAPTVELAGDETTVPFVVPESFPVPVVEVMLNGDGPWRLAVDTAMGGTILLRQELAASMGLPVIGQAMVGDSSGTALKPADLVRIEEMTVGGLTVGNIVGLGFSADNAHLSDVPSDLHGILGNQIYADLLTTLDYPGRRITFARGSLGSDDPSTVAYDEEGRVMVVELEMAGSTLPVVVDSGHRGTITLPRSLAEELPLSGSPRTLDSMSTVSHTYERSASRLQGDAVLAGTRLLEPEIVFADEHSPKLLGFGVLEHFAITIDQRERRLRFISGSDTPIEGISVLR
jgi:predicted aspartyl protease